LTRRLPRQRRVRHALAAVAVASLAAATIVVSNAPVAEAALAFEVPSLDGSGNNLAHPDWGQANRPYLRVAPARYADGVSTPFGGPNSRFVSNRTFNDHHQNVFSESSVSQWGWTWGQFLDHTFGLRADVGGEAANIPFSSTDPLEEFRNDLGVIGFNRSAATPGTGTSAANPRQQTNTESSFIDAAVVYSNDPARLEWLRDGSLDGNVTNNAATLMLPGGYLPRRDARGNPAAAPGGDVDGRLRATPNRSFVAGDKRVNENTALSATQTLFAREHNRIVGLLPSTLSAEDKFQIARRIVMAEEQFITYTEFLPAMGVRLPNYTGYNASVNPTLSNEFATVGYRAHSQIHGEFEFESDTPGRWSQAQLDAFEAQGIEVEVDGDETALVVPLNVAFFNPDLLAQIGLGPVLEGLSGESQYKNDEMIDNQLRSVLFQVPVAGNPDCTGSDDAAPACFQGVVDLGAIDIERGRDHGMPTYNQMRVAYGLPARTSFTAITGESTDQFPAGFNNNTPASLDFGALFDGTGDTEVPGSVDQEANTKRAVRNTTTAARLRATYGSVDNVDAFTGMVAEPHAAGSEFGELQRAIWLKQFQALRDGDRFFYANDPALSTIMSTYHIDYRQTLAKVIAANTDIALADLPPDVFFAHGDVPVTACRVTYTITTTWPGNFQVNMRINNTGTVPTNGRWTLSFSFPSGQAITELWSGDAVQEDRKVKVTNASTNGTIPAGGSKDGIGFNATRGAANAVPSNFTLNTTRCSVG
jgi:hypothetical protein